MSLNITGSSPQQERLHLLGKFYKVETNLINFDPNDPQEDSLLLYIVDICETVGFIDDS